MNILFNLSETVLVLAVITLIHRIGLLDGLWNATVNSGMIANTNTIFNLACAVCLFPMLRVYEKLSDRIVRKEKEATDPHSELIKALNPVFYTTPALALKSCYDVLLTMFTIARENLERAQGQISEFSVPARDRITAVERQVDRLTDNLSRYLVEMLPHLKSETPTSRS